MPKFVISGVSGFRNRGVNALVATTVEGIKTIDPAAKITIISDTSDYDVLHGKKLTARFLQDVFRTRRGKLVRKVSLVSKKLANRLSSSFIEAMDAVEDTDIVIASGGDIFSSDYGDQKDFLIPLKIAQKAGKKVVFMGHSIGPFKTRQEADMWLEVANKSVLITVRESLSYQYVCQQLGVPENKVFLTADSAFVLALPEQAQIGRLASFYGIDSGKPLVALSVSQGIIKFSGADAASHFEVWKKIISTLLNDLGAQVLLVPHVQERAAFNDDRIIQSALVKEFDYDDRIKLVSGDHNASELKGLISLADLVIAERMHAGIAGLSSGVPTALIGYSVKARGVIHDIFGEMAEELELLVSVQDLVNGTSTEKWLKGLWSNRAKIAFRLSAELPKFRSLARKNFELLGALLK
ncbi:polysaccharide pyruvyl transferase family protein [Cohnella faecalis]|uniref:Polysaccharide pyruvyl transferase family protein n=1 Tax=Cohnella faecalis TaxID=2315694 RepID=A0A398CKH9_9BACL|nr:polysaccharide pyruvyl transferase family protein [Cohnella faecalis]RIE03816.1 polysaccharide pyruvyl transferase family protein [Cohnella faecalis]